MVRGVFAVRYPVRKFAHRSLGEFSLVEDQLHKGAVCTGDEHSRNNLCHFDGLLQRSRWLVYMERRNDAI